MSWYVAHSLDQLLAEINASAPGRNKASDGSIGDANHSNSTSDHNPCDCHERRPVPVTSPTTPVVGSTATPSPAGWPSGPSGSRGPGQVHHQ